MSSGRYAAALGLEPRFLNRLRSLVLTNKRMLPGPGAGRRRSPRAGSSVELMDYRNYVPGDDLRRLDWNVYARLDLLFIRVFRAEENLLVRLYLDTSKSMSFGETPKFRLAQQMVAALSYAALVGHDRVETAACGGAALQFVPTASGEVGAQRIWQFLTSLNPDGRGDFHRHVIEASSRLREPGLTILVSDGLFDGGLVPTMKHLLAAGHEVALLHILDPLELSPALEGDFRLTDMENPDRQVEVTLTPAAIADYKQRLEAYCQELKDFCRRHGAAYHLLPADTPIEEAVLGAFMG